MQIVAAVIGRGCTIFAALVFLLFALRGWADGAPYLSVGIAALILCLSLVISASLELKRIARLPAALRIFLQYLIAITAFHFMYAGAIPSSGARMLIADTIVTLLYAVIRVAAHFLKKAFRRNAD